jgi:zinc transport system substrate-binding protein
MKIHLSESFKIWSLLILFAILISCYSCNLKSQKQTTESGKKVVTVTILPQKTFVEKIAGNDFDINVLIPPGTNPETSNLLPSQLKDIVRSAVWFRIGPIGFELSWKEKIQQANPQMKISDLSEGLDLIAETEDHGGHQHIGGIDPHTWMSPKLVKQMAGKIADELCVINPADAPKYKENLAAFSAEIDSIDQQAHMMLEPHKGKKIIVFHPSLTYFVRDYGLEQFSLESGGKEPTPQHMAKVVDLANRENIKVIYIQSDLDMDQATVFAEEINGKIIQVRPLSPDWGPNLLEIAKVISENY